MTEDIAAKIRERVELPAASRLREALKVVLNLHQSRLNGGPTGGHHCMTCRSSDWPCATVRVIAESLGISVSPLRGPSDQSGDGVRPRSGDQNGGDRR